ncbi:hypothetical protein BU25DRAFT_457141 [Macroventuria anomochaeta]|uniref:Uncharacterized protein n=1 Tax=Macroventuria anomochaeta TaxID=301207 RepID=A0ACB6S7K1_9PLEO|nr:uncharacterized protein BU25DRAFT_457141 [Macroventuria anomochaeta]KAF2629487.1 hypothetical protein BU25DRAFT_457141 [Macroventuria anomochaeta]
MGVVNLVPVTDIRRSTFTASTIRSGWRRTGLHPFKPDLVINELKAYEGIDADERHEQQEDWVVAIEHQHQDWNVSVQRTTPDLQSSDIERALGNTPVRSIKRLKETPRGFSTSMKVRWALSNAQLVKDPAPPADAFMRIQPPPVNPMQALDSSNDDRPYQRLIFDDGLPKMDWQVPKSVLEVELQSRAVHKALSNHPPGHLAVPVLRHFQGLSALARIAGGLQQQLLDTQAAESARAERRRRGRRAVQGVVGGPVRPEDVRAMKEQRKLDAIYSIQRELETRLSTERLRIINKWKKLRPTLRNQGK